MYICGVPTCNVTWSRPRSKQIDRIQADVFDQSVTLKTIVTACYEPKYLSERVHKVEAPHVEVLALSAAE